MSAVFHAFKCTTSCLFTIFLKHLIPSPNYFYYLMCVCVFVGRILCLPVAVIEFPRCQISQ